MSIPSLCGWARVRVALTNLSWRHGRVSLPKRRGASRELSADGAAPSSGQGWGRGASCQRGKRKRGGNQKGQWRTTPDPSTSLARHGKKLPNAKSHRHVEEGSKTKKTKKVWCVPLSLLSAAVIAFCAKTLSYCLAGE